MRTGTIILTVSVLLNFGALFYYVHFVWESKYRAALLVGLDFPESTRWGARMCEGSLFNSAIPSVAKVQFHPIQLTKFLSQLQIDSQSVDTSDRNAMIRLDCKAKKGNYLTVYYRQITSRALNVTIKRGRFTHNQ